MGFAKVSTYPTRLCVPNIPLSRSSPSSSIQPLHWPTADLCNLNLMTENDPSDEISRIEARLEELAAVSERCRKIILASKAAIAGGGALLLVTMFGLFGPNQVPALGSIALVLGGIVSLGSNVSTLQQTMAAISAAEAFRSDLISSIDLRVVGDRPMKLI